MEKRFEPSATHGGNKSCGLSTYPNYFLARIDSVEKIPRNARRTNHCARKPYVRIKQQLQSRSISHFSSSNAGETMSPLRGEIPAR
jgi:hypothetical protein